MDELIARIRGASPAEVAALLPVVGLDATLGLRYLTASSTRVEAEWEAPATAVQPYGIVHGGAYCAVIESVASVGAALTVLPSGRFAVGVENRTRFVKAARPGARLRVVGWPRSAEGDVIVWAGEVLDGERQVAEGEVTLRVLPPSAVLAGERVALKPGDPVG